MTHRTTAAASRAIELALRGESFHADDIRRGVDGDPPTQSTIYRVLSQLEEDEWIEQRGNGWQPDMKAQMLRGSGDDQEKNDSEGFGIDMDDIL